jgi:hypothetical protein
VRLGIYAHHVGSGHVARAGAIASAWEGEVGLLTSRPPSDPPPGVEVIDLPRDDEPPVATGAVTPRTLHHAPAGHKGLRTRMGQISAWIADRAPDVMLIDVSVEVALLSRLHGAPTAVVLHPGRRDDVPHLLQAGTVDLVLAPWGAPGRRDGRLHVGLVSRFDDAPRRFGMSGDDRVRVVVAVGTGGTRLRPEDVRRLRAALPADHTVDVLGPGDLGRWVTDPWPVLQAADVVVTSASLNLVAEVAAAASALVVVPEPRPHGEQMAHAEVLASQWDVPVASDWSVQEVVPAVAAARAAGPQPLSDRQGARRAVAALAEVAQGVVA